jgi:hypothetical protein
MSIAGLVLTIPALAMSTGLALLRRLLPPVCSSKVYLLAVFSRIPALITL